MVQAGLCHSAEHRQRPQLFALQAGDTHVSGRIAEMNRIHLVLSDRNNRIFALQAGDTHVSGGRQAGRISSVRGLQEMQCGMQALPGLCVHVGSGHMCVCLSAAVLAVPAASCSVNCLPAARCFILI
jgi:hypothetical protein